MLVKPQTTSLAKIKVVGVGGAGGNAINNMIEYYDIVGVEFIAVNTDAQALANNKSETKLQIGNEITRGLGSGGNPQIGKKAAEESVDMLHEHLAGADLVFITAGMGGGTGTGASPVIAGIAKNLGALTIAIVEKPFHFEGKKRMDTALKGISEIKEKVDTLIVVPNQKLFDVTDENISYIEAMKKIDDVLAQAVRSISQLIGESGSINLDFADIKTIMSNAGTALMGMGMASGENRAENAIKMAISSPLIEMSIRGAKNVLFNIVSSKDLSMMEIRKISQVIEDQAAEDASIYFGTNIDETFQDLIQVTVLATGFDESEQQEVLENTIRGTSSVKVTLKPTSKFSVNNEYEEDNEDRFEKKSKAIIEDDDEDESAGNEKWDEIESKPAFLRNRKKY